MKAPQLSFSCPAQSAVVGTGPVRYCHLCDRAVHDLSAMTEAEARVFLSICEAREVCVSARVVNGQVQHRPPSQLGRVTLALGLGLGGLALASVAGGPEEPAEPQLGGGAAVTLPTTALQDTVRAALADAEAGWPAVDHSLEARRRRVLEAVAEQETNHRKADSFQEVPPPPVPPGMVTMGTFEPPAAYRRDEVELGLIAQSDRPAPPEPKTHLSRQQILSVVKAAAPAVATCADGPLGTVMVDMTIDPSGVVSWARVKAGSSISTEGARCVEEKVSNLRFPSHQGAEMRFNMPFSL